MPARTVITRFRRRGGPHDGLTRLGSIVALRFTEVDGMSGLRSPKGRHVAVDEAGVMGPNQGDVYLIEASVVSDWELFGKLALKNEKGRYKKGNKLTEEEFTQFFEDVDSLLESIYVVAIRKDVVEPSRLVQHDIHAGGLATVARRIFDQEHERIDQLKVTLDFSTQVQPPGTEKRIFETNPYGMEVTAETTQAKRDAGLTANDYLAYAVSEWFRDGRSHHLEMVGGEIQYTVTDYKAMQKIGGWVNHEMNHVDTDRPIEDTAWSYLDVTKDLDENTHIKGRTTDSKNGYEPKYHSSKRDKGGDSDSNSIRRSKTAGGRHRCTAS